MKHLKVPLMVGVLLLGVLLIHGPAAATSTADKSGAITIDGTINDGTEWVADERFTAFVGSFTAFYVTWDNTDLYFAFSGGGSNDRYVVAIDTDPGGMNGDGSEWGGSTFPLYGRPDYIFEYRNGSTYQRGGIDVANVVAARNSGLEIRIPRGELGHLATGSPVGIVMYAGYDDGSYTSCSGRRIFAVFPGPGSYGNIVTSGAGTGCATPVTQWYFPTTDSGRSPTTYGRYQSHIFTGRTVSSASGDQLNDIILDGGTLTGPSSGTINVGRNFVYTAANGGTFTLNSCTVNFNGTGSIKGGHATGVTFHHVAIAGGASLGADTNFLVKGNWTNNGTFAAAAGTATFNGASGATQAISGSNNTFYHLTLNNNGATTSLGSSSVTVDGDFTATAGGMNGGASTVTFTAAAGSIGGASAKSFYNLVIASGAGIAAASGGNITIAGDFTNDGVFTQAASLTTTFNKAGTASLAGSGSTTFGSVLVTGSTTLNAGTHNITVTGATWQVDSGGVFDPGTATVTFDGASTRIQGNNVQQFNNVVINPGKTLTNWVNSWKVRGNWTNHGTYAADGYGTLNFNGSTAQAIGGTASTAFHHLTISNTGADGVTTAADVTLSGELSVAASAKLTIGAGRTLTIASNTYLNSGSTLTGGSGAVLYVNGGTFSNGGTVTLPDVRLDAPGSQYLAGTGTWDVGQMTMGWSQSGNNVLLSNDVALTAGTLEIRRKLYPASGWFYFLTISHPTGATVTVTGTGNVSSSGNFRTQGTVTLNQGGNFDAALYVNPGTTTATGAFDGYVSVASGGTLQAPAAGALLFNYSVIVNSGGTLRGDSSSVLTFNASTGSTLSQNGTVIAPEIRFDGTAAWSVNSSGSWDVGTMIIGYSQAGSTVRFYDLTLNVGTLEVRRRLDLIGSTLTISRPTGASVIVTGTGTVADGSGTLRTQGIVTIVQGGTFTNKVEVNSGTTTAAGTFPAPASGNAITVLTGATLRVAADDTLIVNGPLIVNPGGTLRVDAGGTLGGAGPLTYYSGNTLTNDGTISIAAPVFNSGSAQSLAGAGRFVSNTLGVSSPLTLNSDHQVHGLSIYSGRSLNASGRALSVSGNWSNAGTFIPGGGTVTFNGDGAQSIGGGTSTAFDGLTINNTSADSAGVTLGNHQTVNGTLTLTDGLLKVASYNLTLGTASSISGGSAASMVVTDVDGSATSDGSLCKLYSTGTSDLPPFTFAVGDAYNTTQYAPATANFASTTFNSGAKVCARVTNAAHPSKPAEADYPTWINRYWTVTSAAIATPFSCAVTFAYREDATDDDVHLGASQAEAALFHKVYQGSVWSTKNQADTTNNLLSSTVSGFSDHTAFSGSPLAVDLAFFTASATADGVTLAWETVSEMDNAGFNVYRAASEAGPWTRLNAALIPAAVPGSSAGHMYTWLDATAQPNTAYLYRLEAASLDGTARMLDTIQAPARATKRIWLPAITR